MLTAPDESSSALEMLSAMSMVHWLNSNTDQPLTVKAASLIVNWRAPV